MAILTLDLNRFKASGVYTVEIDASERINVNTNTIRLVVGFSKKGPFNTPVFLRDESTAKKVFGDIDPQLENRGSFFHRSLFTCLKTGPVYALNLLSLNNKPIQDNGDAVEYISYSISSGETNGIKSKALYSSFYNQDRFWKVSEENFIANVNSIPANNGKLFNVVNLSQTPVSIIIKKASNIKGFDITAREWYQSRGEVVPPYIKEYDYISDYFVEVHVVQGNYTDYGTLSKDPVYSKFFNQRGLKKNRMTEFLSAQGQVVRLASFIGCILPNFIDGNNINQSIDTIINNSIATVGLFVAINEEALQNYDSSFYKLDLVGHNLSNVNNTYNNIDFLSYKKSFKSRFDYTYSIESYPNFNSEVVIFNENSSDPFKLKSVKTDGKYGRFDNVLEIIKPSSGDLTFTTSQYNSLKNSIIVDKSIIKLEGSNKYGIIKSFNESISGNDTVLRITYTHPEKVSEKNNTKHSISNGSATLLQLPNILVAEAGLGAGKPILIQSIEDEDLYFYVECARDLEIDDYDGENTNIPIVSNSNMTTYSSVLFSKFKAQFGAANTRRVDLISENGRFNIIYNPTAFTFSGTDTNTTETSSDDDAFYAYPNSQLYKDIENGYIIDGDIYYISNNVTSGKRYIKFNKSNDSNDIPIYKIMLYTDSTLNSRDLDFTSSTAAPSYYFSNDTLIANTNNSNVGNITVYSNSVSTITTPYTPLSWDIAKTKITVNSTVGLNLNVGEYLVSSKFNELTSSVDYKFTKILTKIRKINNIDGTITYEITVNEPIFIQNELSSSTKYIYKFSGLESLIDEYQFTYLPGFTLTNYHIPGDKTNKSTQLEKIFGVLEPENGNLFDTLSSKEALEYRYIIDTFDGIIAPFGGCKNVLSRIAKKRQTCLAFINAPSFSQFSKSTDPRFTDEPDINNGIPLPTLKMEYIAAGGNLSLGPSFVYSLPDEENGAKYCTMCTVYLVLLSGNKNILVPPAAHISNNFVAKFTNSNKFAIVAGPRRGIISDSNFVKLEYDLFTEDREFLEPVGYTLLVNLRGYGPTIMTNNTAYQKTLTALNNVHVRDLLITIEDDIEQLLKNYIFEFNTDSVRSEIRNKVTNYLNSVRTAEGIYDFKVVMDGTNNTEEIIDQNFAILDIAIEPVRGMQKIINRITVFKTGGISTGGFTIV